jgi:phosphoribosylglycinamide formyltransferase-1
VNDNPVFRIAVLGSGTGSNFVAIADACAADRIPAAPVLVLSDVASAKILEQARVRGIPGKFIPPGNFRTKLDEAAEQAYVEALRTAGVDLVVLAGFMRVLKDAFLQAFAGRIINIHPSLLPSFPGLAAWQQAHAHGVRVTGCTVHFVDAGVDSGPIIGQQAVPVLDDDTPESLHARIQVQEHAAYPEAIRLIIAGQSAIRDR